MNSILGFALISAVAFIIANIDDLLLLVMFFSQPHYRFRHILLGQYLGVAALFAISSISYFTKFAIPYSWIKLISLIPILLGVRILANLYHTRTNSGILSNSNKGRVIVFTSSRIISVAILSFAQGSDNVGIYLPLLAGCDAPKLVVTGLIFMFMVTVWCLLGFYLVKKNALGRKFTTYAQLILPFFLIIVGLLVLLNADLIFAPTGLNK